MNEQLRLLVELQKLDSEIIRFNRTIKAIPSRISATEKPLNQARANLEALQKKREDAEKKKRDRESELEDMQARIEKLKTRTADIKDNKAYHTHLREIESAEKAAYEIEDRILAQMEDIEQESTLCREAETALKAEEEKAGQMKKALDEEVTEANKQLKEKMAGRSRYVDGLDKENYDLYKQLLTTKDGLAVTEARGEICTGCNMNIMPQLFVEIKKNEEIFRCPQCGRVLYYQEAAAHGE